MKRLLATAFLLLSPLLRAADDPLAKALERAGGYARFQRAETISYDFEDLAPGSTAPARVGRRVIRLHDGGGLRAREDSDGAGGSLVVAISSSSAWARRDGAPVTDPAALNALAGALRREVFLDLLPHGLKEDGRALHRLPAGFFLGRLLSRAAVDGPPPFSGATGLTLVLSRDESAGMEGLAYGDPSVSVLFTQYEENKSLLVFPARRTLFGRDEKRISTTTRKNISVNAFIDDTLFSPEGAQP